MSQKIQVKFYPLTSDITTMLRKGKLTAAEWRIWSYLIEVDPWGDRYRDLDSLDVMSKCDCSRATFYRAIAKFQKLGLFDIQDKGFSIRNLTGASTLKSDDGKTKSERSRKSSLKNETISVSEIRSESQNCESNLKNKIGVSKMRLDSQICENQSPEPPPNKAFKSPQTIQTYKDFKKTLSEDERENFLKFVKEQIHNLERPINDLEAWLASKNAANQNRWEVYYGNYQKQGKRQKSSNSQQGNGSGDLDRQKAIAKFRKRMKIDRAVNELETSSEEFNSDEPEPRTEPKEFDSNKPKLETEPKEADSYQYRKQKAEFDELLDNALGIQKKSPAQRRKEQIAEARQKQQELEQKKQDIAEARAEQLDPDLEKRKAEMLRQVEEYKQFLQQQKLENPENPEIDVEDSENE